MKKLKYIVFMGLLVMLLTACGSDSAQEAEEEVTESEAQAQDTEETRDEESQDVIPFGAFTSQTLYGEEVTEDIFAEADLTMVNIWATFCSPCIGEMPDLGELAREYEGQGIQIVGILTDVDAPKDETALDIVESTQADYTHIVLSQDLLNGIIGAVQAVPTTVFVDREGNIFGDVYMGAKDKETWQLIIEKYASEVR